MKRIAAVSGGAPERLLIDTWCEEFMGTAPVRGGPGPAALVTAAPDTVEGGGQLEERPLARRAITTTMAATRAAPTP